MAAETTVANEQAPRAGVGSWLEGAKDYLADLKAEMRRVTWPSKNQVQATTAVVIAAVFLFAAYFAVVDLILGRTINQLFQTLARR